MKGEIDSQSVGEIEALFPEEILSHFKNQAKELVRNIQGRKRKKDLQRILIHIEKINGVREKGRLYFNLCKILHMSRDIPSLRSQQKIKTQLNLLHQAIRLIWLTSGSSFDKYPRIGNPAGFSLLIKNNNTNWGVLKQRDEWSEVAVWETSLILDCEDSIAGSLAIHFKEKNFVFQPFQKAKFFNGLFLFPKKMNRRIQKVSEWDFWKANLFLFLIGHRDLTCCNIGVCSNRKLFFCDNEGAFSPLEHRVFKVHGKDFNLQLPTMNLMVDWPQARTPLSSKVAKNVTTLVSNWLRKKDDLLRYMEHPFNDFVLNSDAQNAFEKRYAKTLAMQWISKETTFQGFILSVYPTLYEGVPELVDLSSPIIGEQVSPMSALLFISMCRGWWERMTEQDHENFLRCLEKYSVNK
ncbi:hypothetical protein [Simkania sp.]|uniref:hypothetical protein n=1 Tax=Simkania sp. TaxID=34094 RepID=UPI003B522614